MRLRPAWEDLRSYLTARGRKRFEVYVCTMAERDYALEMWRLLDPDSNLINTKELLDRIVCVKSGMHIVIYLLILDLNVNVVFFLRLFKAACSFSSSASHYFCFINMHNISQQVQESHYSTSSKMEYVTPRWHW